MCNHVHSDLMSSQLADHLTMRAVGDAILYEGALPLPPLIGTAEHVPDERRTQRSSVAISAGHSHRSRERLETRLETHLDAASSPGLGSWLQATARAATLR
jgi:hypothetical protein